jgi:riboflavin biosynthesis pyrimidine reductase
MMATIDGKIASGIEGVDFLDDYFDLYLQIEELLSVQGAMLGRVTMEMFAEDKDTPLPPNNSEIDNLDFIAPHKEQFIMIGIDTKGLLRWNSNTLKVSKGTKDAHIVIVVTNNTPKEYLAYLQSKNISYIIGGQSEIDFNDILKKVKKNFQVERLALEGGGIINGSVMASNLIDEISLQITPQVINKSNAPTMFEHESTELNVSTFKLFEVKQMENECVWLRYKK